MSYAPKLEKAMIHVDAEAKDELTNQCHIIKIWFKLTIDQDKDFPLPLHRHIAFFRMHWSVTAISHLGD